MIFCIATIMRIEEIAYIIDLVPFKQGKYAPAFYVSIFTPDYFFQEPVDSILIIALGYTEEIANSIRIKYGPQVEIAALRTKEIEIMQKYKYIE